MERSVVNITFDEDGEEEEEEESDGEPISILESVRTHAHAEDDVVSMSLKIERLEYQISVLSANDPSLIREQVDSYYASQIQSLSRTIEELRRANSHYSGQVLADVERLREERDHMAILVEESKTREDVALARVSDMQIHYAEKGVMLDDELDRVRAEYSGQLKQLQAEQGHSHSQQLALIDTLAEERRRIEKDIVTAQLEREHMHNELLSHRREAKEAMKNVDAYKQKALSLQIRLEEFQMLQSVGVYHNSHEDKRKLEDAARQLYQAHQENTRLIAVIEDTAREHDDDDVAVAVLHQSLSSPSAEATTAFIFSPLFAQMKAEKSALDTKVKKLELQLIATQKELLTVRTHIIEDANLKAVHATMEKDYEKLKYTYAAMSLRYEQLVIDYGEREAEFIAAFSSENTNI